LEVIESFKSLGLEILNLEKKLLDPLIWQSGDELSELLSEDFTEFGSSGKVYNREEVIKALSNQEISDYIISDFRIKKLGTNSILALYKSVSSGKQSLRSSIWQFESGKWRIIFHQGTYL
jgi:hypothetical protein